MNSTIGSTSTSDAIPDFLQTLGLSPPVSVEDVKQAYGFKVKSCHPDVGGSVADFNALQQAFERALEYAEFLAGRMVWLGGRVEQYMRQQALIAGLEQQGGVVEIQQVDWLKKLVGGDFAQLIEQVVGLALCGPEFGDGSIALLLSERRVTEQLYWLDLSGSRVTDHGVSLLSVFVLLGRLDLRRTPITKRGLEVIDGLQRLEWIGLPAGALSLSDRWQLRRRHPKLKFSAKGEVCAVQRKVRPAN